MMEYWNVGDRDAGARMQDAGSTIQDAGCRMQDAGCQGASKLIAQREGIGLQVRGRKAADSCLLPAVRCWLPASF